jgi:hypothetical protein
MADSLDALEQEIGDYLTGQGTATTFGTGNAWLALYTGAVGNDDGTGWTEVANTFGYARQQISATNMAPTTVAGVATNDLAIQFPPASGGNWGIIHAVGIVSAQPYGTGTIGAVTVLAQDKTVDDGDTFEFAVGDFSVTVT